MTELILRHGFELVLFPTVSPGEPLDWYNSLTVRKIISNDDVVLPEE